ncbi:MAG: class I SAM-dependent methyltransferase, partial [Geminicoccaceae bacterium]
PAGAGLRATAAAQRVGSGVLAQLRLEDDAGLVAFVEGMKFRPVTAASLRDGEASANAADALYTIELKPCPRLDGLLAPDFLPSPDALRDHLAPLAQQLGQRFGIGVYAETAGALDRITTSFIRLALERLGLDWRPGGLLTFGALADELGVDDRHRRLLRRLMAILTEAEQLEQIGPAWRMLPAPDTAEPAAALADLIQAHPAAAAELLLVQRAGPRLAEVLTDSVDPLTLLFPGDGGGAADLYGSSAYARTVNALLSEAMARLRASLPPGRVLRILEVGAGTGGATAALLEALPEGTARYCFTDLSQLFLTAAAKRFVRGDVDFARLDIEQDPLPQGFAPESLDLVVAANVLHATSDVRQSLAHIRGLLAPGGVLVLVETTEARRWVDIVFGLTEGWWRFADRDLRPDHPLLSRARWLEVLAEAGFTADALPAGEIVLAQKPLPAALPEPAVRLLGDPGRVQGIHHDPHAPSALYVAPAAPPTLAGQLELFDGLLGAVRALAAEAHPPALTILSDGALAHAGLPGFLRTLRLE